ncbi:uncharacterized protein F5147DRAFT_657342 [Suillus discolor]|uniref:DUF6533 domain-containing protein n=1 Tax=Suillus discolor TaxID=1912936 RepID=A0A9P7JP30_9AGAM|nr:uncharacterized protein F5147DRAFT_657342 [Suillus discolor]KAG2093720.1 hypothetical protein F5147DRAFT_657342 [Suillus discolor]
MESHTFIHLSTILQSQDLTGFALASLVASWVYDCFLTLDQEVSLIHRPPWSKGSILYIMARYMPALMLSVYLCTNYFPNEKFVTCKILQSAWYFPLQVRPPGTVALCMAGAEGIFILRTYALWGTKEIHSGPYVNNGTVPGDLERGNNTEVLEPVEMSMTVQLSDIGGGCYSLYHDTKAAYNWSLMAAFELGEITKP